MPKVGPILVAVALALSISASAALAQSNSGIDQYGESPPSATGDPGTGTPTGTDGTSSGTPSGTVDSGVAGSSGTGVPLSEQAAGTQAGFEAASGAPGARNLPATGSETAFLAAIGIALLSAGLIMQRRLRTQG